MGRGRPDRGREIHPRRPRRRPVGRPRRDRSVAAPRPRPGRGRPGGRPVRPRLPGRVQRGRPAVFLRQPLLPAAVQHRREGRRPVPRRLLAGRVPGPRRGPHGRGRAARGGPPAAVVVPEAVERPDPPGPDRPGPAGPAATARPGRPVRRPGRGRPGRPLRPARGASPRRSTAPHGHPPGRGAGVGDARPGPRPNGGRVAGGEPRVPSPEYAVGRGLQPGITLRTQCPGRYFCQSAIRNPQPATRGAGRRTPGRDGELRRPAGPRPGDVDRPGRRAVGRGRPERVGEIDAVEPAVRRPPAGVRQRRAAVRPAAGDRGNDLGREAARRLRVAGVAPLLHGPADGGRGRGHGVRGRGDGPADDPSPAAIGGRPVRRVRADGGGRPAVCPAVGRRTAAGIDRAGAGEAAGRW